MKLFSWIILLVVFISCSSSDNSIPNPPDDIPLNNNVNLEFVWEKEITNILPQALVYDALNRPYFYLAAKGGGLIVYRDEGESEPVQVIQIPITDLQMLHVMYVYQKGNYLYLALGDFFGSNSKAGLAIIDINNPTNPIVEDIWESDEVISGSAIVTVEDNFAYLGAMEYGFYIFDISNPEDIIEKSNYVPNIHYPVENPDNAQIPNARGMTVVGNRLYLCYDAGGVRIIDVSNKELPDEIGKFHNNESIENTPKAYNNIIINGNLAYCAVDYCGFEIWNLSNIDAPELVGWWNPWECESLNNIWWNSPGHANQMVYDNSNDLVFVNTGRSDLSVLDVSDETNPILKASYGISDDSQATWGMNMYNNDIYLLYIEASVPLYSNWSGIKKINWGFVLD